MRALALLALGVILTLISWRGEASRRRLAYEQPILLCASLAIASIVVFHLAGCGGGYSAAPTPGPTTQQVVTPQGTSTITVTPAATTASGKQLSPLPPVQLTLVVK